MENYLEKGATINEALLKVDHIDVLYGSFQALWDVSLEVKSGEIVALIGANSSGKSTLLDSISGSLRPAKGTIIYEGNDIAHATPYNIVSMGIAHVPEGRRVFPEMTVLDNLIIGSFNKNARPAKKQNLEKVYELFPILSERKNQPAKTLSGGEQQMLAIGRGLMENPKMMLLDEMSLGLSPKITNMMYQALRQICSEGITILFVEQNVRRSLVEADRAYIMEAGRIVLSGNVADLRQNTEIQKAYFGI
jgi:branched-chain amino acid transport system ATP-binding protein